jgi:hypothetical protein
MTTELLVSEPSEPDDFLAELDAELSALASTSTRKAQAEALKKKLANTRLSTEVRREAREEYRIIQAQIDAHQWIPTASIALFSEQTCDGCGSVHRTFLQFMEQQAYKPRPSTVRSLRVEKINLALDREVIIQPLQTHVCADCCHEHGFAFVRASFLKPAEFITTSPTYQQEDINAQG